jgi:Uma2 family endonuclease
MLEEDALLLLPTEEDLPDSDEQPVDNELQLLAPGLLRAILLHIWKGRWDWFFGLNLGVYYDPNEAAIGPDAFLSLGVDRVRPDNKLRLSYLVYREGVMPQWVLEVVSQTPGGEYEAKFRRYAAMGVLYYTIYNPSHYRRDGHDAFELYRLEGGQYVRQVGNPVWMPEVGLGIGHEVGREGGIRRDWLYWYDENGVRYLPPEDLLEQERVAREREQLMRRELEERLMLEEEARIQLERSLTEAEQSLVLERRSIARNLLGQGLGVEAIALATGLSVEVVEGMRAGGD